MNEVIDGKKYSQALRDKVKSFVEIIKEKKNADPETSYTASLFKDGLPRITQKVGEEAVETIIATLSDKREDVISESSDMLYHLLVMLEARGIEFDEVVNEMRKRDHTLLDKKTKK